MKSTLIYFFSFIIVASAVAQTNADTPNSPGEDIDASATTSTSASITKEDYLAFKSQIEKRASKVESRYYIEREEFNSYNGTYFTTTTAVKSKIYKAGQILVEDQQSKLEVISDSDFKSKYARLKQINKIYDRLMFFSGQPNTRSIEKKLKKLKEPAEISEVFFSEE